MEADTPAPAHGPAPDQFRRALGHYPTGVVLIATTEPDGSPVAVVVGTFTSVSLEPPLVGFLIDRRSTSWPRIRATGYFTASVLTATQENVCRAFATKADDRFVHCTPHPRTGRPRLARSGLWLDCRIEAVHPAGDHEFVLGRVTDLEMAEDAGPPLLFHRGGYGAPSIPSLQAEGPGLGPQLRLTDLVRPEVESVARELGYECAVTAAVREQVVVLATAGLGTARGGSDTHVGSTFPLAAPIAPHLVAWADPAEQHRWIVEGNRLAGTDVTQLAAAELAAVRNHGYVVTTGRAGAQRFERAVFGAAAPADDAFRDVLRELVESGARDVAGDPVDGMVDVVSMHVPVRDGDGRVVLSLDLLGFIGDETPETLRRCLDRLRTAAARATVLLAAPPDQRT